jgi:hypothetical protein
MGKIENGLTVGELVMAFAEDVSQIVGSCEEFCKGAGKNEALHFRAACMGDVSDLSNELISRLAGVLKVWGGEAVTQPTEATEADVISLEVYRLNGGLIN